jgi:uncharacterized SAM-binding protein YcdF (DUF218 family)
MEYTPHLVVTIAILITTVVVYTLAYYFHYRRGAGRRAEQSTLLDGLILISIVIVLAGGSPWGNIAVELTIVSVGALAALRLLELAAHWLANRQTKQSPAGRE